MKMNGLRGICLGVSEQAVPMVGYLLSLANNNDQKETIQIENQETILTNKRIGTVVDQQSTSSEIKFSPENQREAFWDLKNTLIIHGPPDITDILARARRFAAINTRIIINLGTKLYGIEGKKNHDQVVKFDTNVYSKSLYSFIDFAGICSTHQEIYQDINIFLKENFKHLNDKNIYRENGLVSNYLLLPEDHQGTLDITRLLQDHPRFPLRRCKELKQGHSVNYELFENQKNIGTNKCDEETIGEDSPTMASLPHIVHPDEYVTDRLVFQNILVLEDIALLTDHEIQKHSIKYFFLKAEDKRKEHKWIDKIICMNERTVRSLIFLQVVARFLQRMVYEKSSSNPKYRRISRTETCPNCSHLKDLHSAVSFAKLPCNSLKRYGLPREVSLCPSHFTFLLSSPIFVSCSVIKMEPQEIDLASNYRLSEKLNSLWNSYQIPNINSNLKDKNSIDQYDYENTTIFRDGDILDLRHGRNTMKKEHNMKKYNHCDNTGTFFDSKEELKNVHSLVKERKKSFMGYKFWENNSSNYYCDDLRNNRKTSYNDPNISPNQTFQKKTAHMYKDEPDTLEILSCSSKKVRIAIYHNYLDHNLVQNTQNQIQNDHLMFLGTAAAIPTKYRNVSGILYHYRLKSVRRVHRKHKKCPSNPHETVPSKNHVPITDLQENIKEKIESGKILDNNEKYNFKDFPNKSFSLFFYNSILLDCGEDTLSQIYRTYPVHQIDHIIRSISMIFISHSHADHHIGCLQIIKKWTELNYKNIKASEDHNRDFVPTSVVSIDQEHISQLSKLKTSDSKDEQFSFDPHNVKFAENILPNANFESEPYSNNEKTKLNGISDDFTSNEVFENKNRPNKCTKTCAGLKKKQNSEYKMNLSKKHLLVFCPNSVKQFLNHFDLPVKYILTDSITQRINIEIVNIRQCPFNSFDIEEKNISDFNPRSSNEQIRKKPKNSHDFGDSVTDETFHDSIKISFCKMDHIENSRAIRIDTNYSLASHEDIRNILPTPSAQLSRLENYDQEYEEFTDSKHKMTSKLLKTQSNARSVCYSGDSSPCTQFFDLARKADLIIHDCTFIQNVFRARQTKHTTMKEAIKLWQACGAKRLILTHFSQRIRSLVERQFNEDKKQTKQNTKSEYPRNKSNHLSREHLYEEPHINTNDEEDLSHKNPIYNSNQHLEGKSDRILDSESHTAPEKICRHDQLGNADKFAYLGAQGKANLIKDVFIAYDYFKYEFDMEWKEIVELEMEEVDI